MIEFLKRPLLAVSVNFGAGFLTVWQAIEPFCSFIAFGLGVVIGVYSLINAIQQRRINAKTERLRDIQLKQSKQ